MVPFLIVTLNLGVLSAFSLALTRSVETALLAALFGCYHSRLDLLYFSSSHIYELLCYPFYFGALLVYIRRRRDNSGSLGVGSTVVILLFQTLALGAKEVAVTLPAVLVVYELAPNVGWPWKARIVWKRWWGQAGICLLCSLAISLLFCVRKLWGATPLKEAYHPNFSASFVLENWRRYFAFMLYRNDPVPLALLLGVWVVLALLAAGLRSKVLMVCCA